MRADGEARKGTRTLRWAGRIALIVLPVVLLLLATEAVLWMLDAGSGRSLLRGFDPDARYLVPDEGGGWRTQIFADLERREVVVPPRDDRRRVLLIGGSNVQIMPHDYLAEMLGAPAGDRGWEVINLGRQGYGSERLSILLRQAMVLEPDVVVIYSGHNEFVERGFRGEIARRWGNPVMRALARAFSHTRVFNALVSVAAPPPEPDVMATDRPPELVDRRDPVTRVPSDPAALHIPWEETLRYWEAYGRNLSIMCRAALDGGAKVVLCTVVGNHLWPPVASTLSADLAPETVQRFEALLVEAEALVPERWTADQLIPRGLRAQDWYAGDHEDPWSPTLRPLSGRLARAPRTIGVSHSPEGAHWPDPEHWNDDVLNVMEAVERVVQRAVPDADRAALRSAGQRFEAALAVVPDHPQTLFRRGIVTWLLGEDDARAAELLARAAAHDRAPRSGNDTSNRIVRAVAAEVPGVKLLDVDARFRACTPNGLVGYELVMDSCHLQPGVRNALMDVLAEVIRRTLAE